MSIVFDNTHTYRGDYGVLYNIVLHIGLAVLSRLCDSCSAMVVIVPFYMARPAHFNIANYPQYFRGLAAYAFYPYNLSS